MAERASSTPQAWPIGCACGSSRACFASSVKSAIIQRQDRPTGGQGRTTRQPFLFHPKLNEWLGFEPSVVSPLVSR